MLLSAYSYLVLALLIPTHPGPAYQPREYRRASLYQSNVNAVNMQTVLIPVEFVCFNHPSQIK